MPKGKIIYIYVELCAGSGWWSAENIWHQLCIYFLVNQLVPRAQNHTCKSSMSQIYIHKIYSMCIEKTTTTTTSKTTCGAKLAGSMWLFKHRHVIRILLICQISIRLLSICVETSEWISLSAWRLLVLRLSSHRDTAIFSMSLMDKLSICVCVWCLSCARNGIILYMWCGSTRSWWQTSPREIETVIVEMTIRLLRNWMDSKNLRGWDKINDRAMPFGSFWIAS